MRDDRVERAVGAEGGALEAQPSMGLPVESFPQRFQNARLTEPGFAGQQHHLALAAPGLPPTLEQELDFLLAAYERAQPAAASRLEAGLGPAAADDTPDRHGCGEALELALADVFEVEGGTD